VKIQANNDLRQQFSLSDRKMARVLSGRLVPRFLLSNFPGRLDRSHSIPKIMTDMFFMF